MGFFIMSKVRLETSTFDSCFFTSKASEVVDSSSSNFTSLINFYFLYQYYCGKGGTDAGAAHLQSGGVPSTTIGVCARYIHSHQTLYAMDDFLQAQAFLQALVKKLDRSTVDTITNY